ncbi:MAG: tripartite tricarboxylate transporter substrate binding protein [Desulfobacteraceae bacterium]|nr:MAG: tripartite tricarboxylate transporter substrate binding protein [Desulfobacteraceae bacterium]
MRRKTGLLFIVVAVALSLCATGAFAQKFPAKDITLVVPWAAGGGTDTIARTLVKNAKNYFGVNVNVVNKTGGLGAIGMGSVATAPPDGYTVGVITFHLSNYKMMGLANLSFRDYSLIQMINQEGAAASVAANSQFKTLKDLLEYAKKNPGVVTAGHAGAGSVQHLSLAALGLRENVKFAHVPFDGSAPARTAVVGGHVTVAVTTISEVLQMYRGKMLKVLYTEDTKRHWLYPDVPTIAEAGYPNQRIIYDWRALAAPKGVPEDRMKILVEGFKKCFDDPEFQKMAYELGLATVYMDAAALEKFLSDMESYHRPALEAVGLLKEK